jgi:hypothetical protein
VGFKTNKSYFDYIFKFVLLFRECFNKLKSSEVNTPNEYTQMFGAESVPDICNEFIVEFMEPEEFYGLDTNELIEVIQHLCHWLYGNGYTTSRLTLL